MSVANDSNDQKDFSFSADGSLVAFISDKQTVRLMETATRRELHSFTARGKLLFAVSLSPDAKFIAAFSGDGAAKLWSVRAKKRFRFPRFPEPGAQFLVCNFRGMANGLSSAPKAVKSGTRKPNKFT